MEEQKEKKQGHEYKSLLVWNIPLKRIDENYRKLNKR